MIKSVRYGEQCIECRNIRYRLIDGWSGWMPLKMLSKEIAEKIPFYEASVCRGQKCVEKRQKFIQSTHGK